MKIYRLEGKEKLTGNMIYSAWYSATNPIEVVEKQFNWFSDLAYDVQVVSKDVISLEEVYNG
ncbi:MAG: hypothetical protein LIR50_22120 [Bacillota bacterium]|nr:hypothetical protein [Bacillota bacterium]